MNFVSSVSVFPFFSHCRISFSSRCFVRKYPQKSPSIMAPDTRPPLSHLRPTLSTRLRKSFEGKRSKTTETPTTNGSSHGPGSPGLEIDPDVLRHAIEQAIMGESFQMAIAANLANIVKPAIKSALDTIQPVVEAVYSHDLLLRKTNKSVERLLDNMDTIAEEDEGRPQVERSTSAGSFYDMEFKALLEKSNKRTVATLAELSNAVQSNNSRLAILEASFRQMKENTTLLFSSHGNKLDLMALFITELKDQSELSDKLESVSGELNGLRASVDAGTGMNNGGIMELGARLDTIVSTTHTQAGALDEIKNSTAKSEILAAIQTSHDYHDGRSQARSLIDASANTTTADNTSALHEIKTYLATHSTVLGEIKERSLVAPVETTGGDATSATLQEIKTYLETHSTVLDELKERPATLDTDTTATIQELKTYLESQSTVLEELKGRPIVDGAENTAILQDIKSHLDSHSVALGEIQERSIVPETVDGPEASLPFEDIKSHLESHSTALNELKERSLAPPSFDTTEITTSLDAIKTQLESHATLLEEIKEVSIVPEVSTETSTTLETLKTQLESLKEIIETGYGSNNEVVGVLESKIDNILVTIEGHKATDSSTEILAALQKSNDSHDSHATALDGVKSLVVVPSPVSDPVDLTGVESQLTTITTTLEGYTTALSEFNTREPPPFVSDEALNLEVKSISATLETHTKLLNEIKDNVSAEILTALHDMGQTQTLHTATLAELRDADMSDEILTALHTSNEAHSGHQAEFEKLHGAVRGFDEKYEKHGVDLGEIKSRSLDVPAAPEGSSIEDLEAKIGGIVSILEEQNTALSSIQSSTNSAVESHSAHALSFGQLHSRSLEVPVVEKFDTSELEAKIAGIVSILDEQNAALSSIKEGTQSALDSHTAHTLTLGEINSRALESASAPVVEEISNAELEAKIAGIVTILEEQNVELSSIKQSTESALDSHSAHAVSLGEMKSRSLELPEGPSNSDLELKIAAMAEALEQQKSTLADIHTSTNSALESHASHAISLGEMKSRSLEEPAVDENAVALEAKINGIVEVLEQQKSTLSEIHTSTNSALESHVTHAVSLDEIKTRSLEPAAPLEIPMLQELESKIVNIISILEGQAVALSTLKDSTSAGIDSHTSSLDEIKASTLAQRDLHDSHAATLSEIKDAALVSRDLHSTHSATLADLVIATGDANDSHASHSSTLAELKALPPPPAVDLSSLTVLETDLKSIIETLSTHTTSLSEINTSSSTANPELFASIKESHDLLSTHTVLLDSIKSSSSTSHEELLTNLTGLKSTLEDTKSDVSSHTTALSEINTLASTANPDLLASIKESHDLLSTHTILLDSIKSSSSDSHEEVLTNLKSVHSTLEDTKSEVSTHGSLVKDLHSETKDSHSSLTTAISALAIGGAAGAGLGFLAFRGKDEDEVEESPKTVVERSITPPLAEEKETESAPEPVEEPIVERSISPAPEEEQQLEDEDAALPGHTEEIVADGTSAHLPVEEALVPEEIDNVVVEPAILPSLDTELELEPESSSLPENTEEDIVERSVTPLPEGEMSTLDEVDDLVERAITPAPDADLEPEITSFPDEESIVERSLTTLPLEEQAEIESSLPISEELVASEESEEIVADEELPTSISEMEEDLKASLPTDEVSESVARSLTPDLDGEIESIPIVEDSDLPLAEPIEEPITEIDIADEPSEPIEEPVTEIDTADEPSEPSVERSFSPDLVEESESVPDVEVTELPLSLPVEDEAELPVLEATEDETEPLVAEIVDDEPLSDDSVTPIQVEHDTQVEEPISNDISEIQDHSLHHSLTSVDDDSDLAASQNDEVLPIERSITPFQEDQESEFAAPSDELEIEQAVTPSPDHDISTAVEQSTESPIERSVTPVEQDDLQLSEVVDEPATETVEPVSQEDSIPSSLPIADEFTSDEHEPELSLLESTVIENHEADDVELLDESPEPTIKQSIMSIDETSSVESLPSEETFESHAHDDIPLDQPQIESSMIETQEPETVSLEESRELATEKISAPIDDEESLPIDDEAEPSQDAISLDLSTEPVVSAETAEEVVEKDVTVHHDVTILPPIVVEDNTEQETILEPEFVESSEEIGAAEAVLDSEDGPSEDRGVSPEPIIDTQAEDDDILPSDDNEVAQLQDSDDLTEQVDSDLTVDVDETLKTSIASEILDDDEISPHSESDELAPHVLPVEIDTATQSELTAAPLAVDLDDEQTSSDGETENSPVVTEQATQSSESIELAEEIDRDIPDLGADLKFEEALSDAGSETTTIQNPIELVEQTDRSLPDVEDDLDDSADAPSPTSSPEIVVAQIVADLESQAGEESTPLEEDSPSLPSLEESLKDDDDDGLVVNTEDDVSVVENDVESHPLPVELHPVEVDTTLPATELDEDTTQGLSPVTANSTVSDHESSPVDIDQTQLSKDLALDSDVNNNESPVPSPTVDDQSSFPSQIPGDEHDILDAHLTPEADNGTLEPIVLDEEEAVDDSEHAVTRTTDHDDDVMSVMSSDDVVSPSEWMFRSSGPKSRNFSPMLDVEVSHQNLDMEENSQPAAEVSSYGNASSQVASVEEPDEAITQDDLPTVAQILPVEDGPRSLSIDLEDEPEVRSPNRFSHGNDDSEHDLDEKDTTPIATPAHDNQFDFGFTHDAESSNLAHSPIAEASPLFNQSSIEVDNSPVMSPVKAESVYSAIDDSVDHSTPFEEATYREPRSSFASAINEKGDFKNDHQDSSDMTSPSPRLEEFPLPPQARLEDPSPLSDEAIEFEDEEPMTVPAPLTANSHSNIASSPPMTASIPADHQTTRLEDLSPLSDESFDFEDEQRQSLPAQLHASDAPQHQTLGLSSSPVLSAADEKSIHVETSSPDQPRELDSSPLLSPADDHFEHNQLNEQEQPEAASTTQDEPDERYKRPSSADPYDDEDMVVEWSGKDDANTESVSASVQHPEEVHETGSPAPPLNSALNEPSSPVLETHLPDSSVTAPDKPNVFQYMDYEPETAEASSPIAVNKGKEVDDSSVDPDKQNSEILEPVPDYLASDKNEKDKEENGMDEEVLSPGLAEQTESEPTTPAIPEPEVEVEPSANVAKKAAGGGKKKKGKKGKK